MYNIVGNYISSLIIYHIFIPVHFIMITLILYNFMMVEQKKS